MPRVEAASPWCWGLSLVGYGQASQSWAVAETSPIATGPRVEYRRGGIEESYENSPLGLEQIFILRQPPSETAQGRQPEIVPGAVPARTDPSGSRDWIHLDLALWGDLSPRIAEDGQSIDFVTPSGAPVLRYSQLKVTDARSETLSAWMEGFAGEGVRGIRIVVDARNAQYPVTIDPLTTSAAWTVYGDQAGSQFGGSVATAGDVNGDGYSDVIVGAYNYTNGQAEEGKVYLYLGSASGPSMAPVWSVEGDEDRILLGISVAAAGDVNGDGYGDVLVGGANYNSATMGIVYLYLGSSSGLSTTPAWTAQAEPVGTSTFGASVAGAGDVNGDGYADVVIGDPAYSLPLENLLGKAYLYLGAASGLTAAPVWTVTGSLPGEELGISVSTGGDVNGDGYADLLIGAYDELDTGSSGGPTHFGQAMLFFGSAAGPSATPDWAVSGNQSGGGYGFSVSTAGDVQGDGYADLIVGAYFYTNGQTGEGRAYVYLGSSSGPAATPAWTTEGNQIAAFLGRSVATAGDVNGDGYADVIVGAYNYQNGQLGEGRADVYLGSASGLAASPIWTAEGDLAGARFGYSVATAGDVNGDGFSDVLVGAPQDGRASIYTGSAGSLRSNASWTQESNQANAMFGLSVGTAGDVNGDGYSDVIVGAHLYDNGQVDEGRAYLYLGSASGLSTIAAWSSEGDQDVASFGISVGTGGDVNGDGYSDVVVAAPQFDNGEVDEGRVYLFLGSAGALSALPAWTAETNQAGAQLGCIATAGDVNGDGYSDVIVGSRYYDDDQNDEGRVWLYLGSAAGLSPAPVWTAEGNQASDQYGSSASTAGDVNGDGYSDVVVGAYQYDNGQTDEGRAWLYLGSGSGLPAAPAWIAESDQATSWFGARVRTAGDVNGDGYSDVLVVALNYDHGQGQSGRAYVYLGSASGLQTSASWTADGGSGEYWLGHGAGTAGDVNGDGYSDLILGSIYNNGEVDEGRALLFLGSAAGLPANPAWTVEGNQASSFFGSAASTAGDVNGDGYADVIVGAVQYDNGEVDEGRAFVYYGNAGGGLGRIPRQARTDGATPIALLGRSDSGSAIRLRERGITAAGRGKIRLQWEVKPLSTPFNGSDLNATTVRDTGAPGASGSATGFNEPVTGLAAGTFYHWRARIVSADPLFPRSPWMSLAGNGISETKLRTSGCIDGDGDGYGAPADPSCANPALDCNGADPTIWGTPGETSNLVFTSSTTMSWSPPSTPGGLLSSLVYDMLRAGTGADFASAVCVESDDGSNVSATDASLPVPGQAFFYLTRAQNACPSGAGTLGTTSSGVPRPGPSCP